MSRPALSLRLASLAAFVATVLPDAPIPPHMKPLLDAIERHRDAKPAKRQNRKARRAHLQPPRGQRPAFVIIDEAGELDPALFEDPP